MKLGREGVDANCGGRRRAMVRSSAMARILLLKCLFASMLPVAAQTQTTKQKLITQPVDEQKLVTLAGSTRPEVRAAIVTFPRNLPTLKHGATNPARMTGERLVSALVVMAWTASIIAIGICMVVVTQSAATISAVMRAWPYEGLR